MISFLERKDQYDTCLLTCKSLINSYQHVPVTSKTYITKKKKYIYIKYAIRKELYV